MQSLPELQQHFARAITGAVAELPVRSHGLSAAQRLQVYRNNTRSALTAALRAVYPVTERLVGEEFFAAAAATYIKKNSSHSGNIQDYGGAFPQFLEAFEPAASLPYLGDVAALEWYRLQAALAPLHTPMDIDALARVPKGLQPALRFQHQPAVRTLASRFPILTIWEYCQEPAPEVALDIGLPGECLLFARPGLDVYMRRLTPGEYAFLWQFCLGHTFEQACRGALEAEPGFDVERGFAGLVREEILTGFHH